MRPGAFFPWDLSFMTLPAIVLATLVAGVGSVWIAAWLNRGLMAHQTPHMLSLAAGALLGALIAARSAAPRRGPLGELISGK